MEGQSFEKQHETSLPQPETGPEVDIESVLERGEIEAIEKLEGHSSIEVVTIKDDGKGLFKRSEYQIWDEKERLYRDENRAELELLARNIDKILGFKLVPEIVSREIKAQKGILQRFVSDATYVSKLVGRWSELVDVDELRRAAVFDFIIGASDRGERNFLVNETTGKLWLIDHDYYMFLDDLPISTIVEEVRRRNLTALTAELVKATEGLRESIDSLMVNSSNEVKRILAKSKTRVQALLEHKTIPV